MQPESDVEAIEIALLLEAIYAKYGCDLRGYARGSMRRRVLGALRKSGLNHIGELQHKLLYDASFFADVLSDLTVQVTSLFRDPAFHQTFRRQVVPTLRTYPLLRIWHAGCASGEEAYASAILLSEEGLYERAQIYATDLSPHALAQAKAGVYPASYLQAFQENYKASGGTGDLSNYITSAYDGIAMKESLRRNILFFQHDLVADYVFGEMHVIFCRNVLIYFDAMLRTAVLEKFVKSLCAGGFFCLGASERLSREDRRRGFAEFHAEHGIWRQRESGQ